MFLDLGPVVDEGLTAEQVLFRVDNKKTRPIKPKKTA
jgi:hypothetical protein